MDAKFRNILETNRTFLEKNIILGDEFYGELRNGKVLTETMIQDIQEGPSPKERNGRLISFIQMKGSNSFRKFRNVLQITGHNFIADHLYEEEFGHVSVKMDNIFKKFDDVFSCMSDERKNKFKNYLNGKVKETILQLSWKSNPTERCDILDIHSHIYKQEKQLRDSIEEKDRKIIELQNQLTDIHNELEKTNLALFHANTDLGLTESRFHDKLLTQSKFNTANNNTIMRLNESLQASKTLMKHLNKVLENYMMTGDMDVDELPIQLSDSPEIHQLTRNISRCLQYVKRNSEGTTLTQADEKRIRKLVPKEPRDKPLLYVLKDIFEKDVKLKNILNKEIKKLKNILFGKTGSMIQESDESLEELELIKLRTSLSMITAEVEHLKRKISWKDEALNKMENDIRLLMEADEKNNEDLLPTVSQSPQTVFSELEKSTSSEHVCHNPVSMESNKTCSEKQIQNSKEYENIPKPSFKHPSHEQYISTVTNRNAASPDSIQERVLENFCYYLNSETDFRHESKQPDCPQENKIPKVLNEKVPTRGTNEYVKLPVGRLKKDNFVSGCSRARHTPLLKNRASPAKAPTRMPLNINQLTFQDLVFK